MTVTEYTKKHTIVALATLVFFFMPAISSAATLININTADLDTLDTLPGIGPAKAQAIIDYRVSFGSFGAIDEIQNVSGIGPATYADIESLITVSGSTSTANDTEEITIESATSGGGSNTSEKQEKIPIQELIVGGPSVAFVNQVVTFSVKPRTTFDRLVRYTWYFGDTHQTTGSNPTHTFTHPGTYVVTVESYYAKETIMGRYQISVVETELALARDVSGDITITNDAQYEIDLGGFVLIGRDAFTIPKYTVVLPGETLTLATGDTTPHQLLDPMGHVVAHEIVVEQMPQVRSVTIQTPQPEISSTSTSRTSVDTFIAPETPLVLVDPHTNVALAADGMDTEPMPQRTNTMAYLGLIGLLLIGTLGVLLKR